MLVQFAEVSHLLHNAIAAKLRSDQTIWVDIESEAAKLCAQVGGFALPVSDRPTELDWVVLPMAWVCQYLAATSTGTTVASDETAMRHFERQYDHAMALLKQPHPRSLGSTMVSSAEIEGLWP